jgi:hypothetical protein
MTRRLRYQLIMVSPDLSQTDPGGDYFLGLQGIALPDLLVNTPFWKSPVGSSIRRDNTGKKLKKKTEPPAYTSFHRFICTTFAGGNPLKYVEDAWEYAPMFSE